MNRGVTVEDSRSNLERQSSARCQERLPWMRHRIQVAVDVEASKPNQNAYCNNIPAEYRMQREPIGGRLER